MDTSGFLDLLDHTCDIYHMVRESDKPVGFGIKNGTPHFSYPDEPDESGVPCHFNLRNKSTSVSENKPKTEVAERVKLNLPLGTDIRVNDKVVQRETGMEYTAEQPPPPIRGHHQIVWVYRTSAQKPV